MTDIDTQGLEIFFQECEDLFGEIEESILAMESNPNDMEAVNTAFRGYHTVKGGAAMFGLTGLTDFAHHVESVLSDLRDGLTNITPHLISALLESMDCLKEFIGHHQEKAELNMGRIESNLQVIQSFAASKIQMGTTEKHSADLSAEPDTRIPNSQDGKESHASEKIQIDHYLIKAKFQEDLLARGSDPISFLDDLKGLGKTIVIPHSHRVPTLDLLDPGKLYLQWTIKMETRLTKEEIDGFLMFYNYEHDISLERINKPPEETKEKAKINAPTEVEDQATSAPEVISSDQNQISSGTNDTPLISRISMSPASPSPVKINDSIRVSINKLDKLVNLVGEAVINQARFVRILNQVSEVDEQLGESLLQLLDDNDMVIREVQDQVLNIRMVPIQGVFSPLQRMVRSYSVESGKQIRIQVTGGETELDKTLTEKLSGPLKHLIRNAMDHGIEMPQSRQQAGKDETGLISVNAFQEEGHIVIDINDDGKGIHTGKILESAVKKGLITPDEQLSTQEVYQLLFKPGFSTAKDVTDVSGRGVGMDVVKRDIESLHGNVTISSEPGSGTQFRIKLPLTLAIIEGMLIRVGDDIFTLPLLSIMESMKPRQNQIKTIKKRGEVIDVRGEYIPLIRLHELFNLSPGFTNPVDALVIIVENLAEKYGLLVDNIEEQQQIVIKSLEDNFVQLPGIAGATILGDGHVSLILEIAGLIKLSQKNRSTDKTA